MQIHFVERNIEITPALKTFTTEKMQRLEKRHANISQINVTLHSEKQTFIAEATIRLDGVELHATAKSDDMYNSIDELLDKLITQITKHKEKTGHH